MRHLFKPKFSIFSISIFINSYINNYSIMAAFMMAATIPVTVYAQDDNVVHVCVAEDGTPTYTNNTVGLKGCKPLSGVFVTTIPAFKPPINNSSNNNNNINNNNNNNNINNNSNNNVWTSRSNDARNNVGPADFPKVDGETQRQRDENGRRPILERELQEREKRCNLTKQDLTAPTRLPNETEAAFGQRIQGMQLQTERCAADLAAIRRELSNLK